MRNDRKSNCKMEQFIRCRTMGGKSKIWQLGSWEDALLLATNDFGYLIL